MKKCISDVKLFLFPNGRLLALATCQPEKCGKHGICKRDCDDFFCECKPGFHLPNGGSEFKGVNENNCEGKCFLELLCMHGTRAYSRQCTDST